MKNVTSLQPAKKGKLVTIRFDKTNKATIKDASNRTRSGASNGPTRVRAHGRHHKH